MSDFEDHFDQCTKVWLVYQVLKDRQWHCRECEYAHVGTTQIAGGSGIQGLQRGTKKRPGMKIESGNHLCAKCGRQTRQDRWMGHYLTAIPAPSMPESFASRAIMVLGSRDVVDNTSRPPNQLTIDHKLPMVRWNSKVAKRLGNFAAMTDRDIHQHFQLLRASNGSLSHNLLKSRACERCFRTGRRGTPFGVVYFYKGGPKWKPTDKKNPKGCIGCGWYDFDRWRDTLNKRLQGIRK